MKKKRGITLIALVITIIVLLILAGVTLNLLMSNEGILNKASSAVDKTEKAKRKEELEMIIVELQMDQKEEGKSLTIEVLKDKLNEKEEINAELENGEIVGEYKGYDYTIDENFKVEIGEKIFGVKPKGNVEILTTEYRFEGTVEIKVTASITEGKIQEIVAPEGASLKTSVSETEKIYEVTKSGSYVFEIVADNGRKAKTVAKVDKILETPQIGIQEITGNSFKIQVENNYPQGVITEYKYYVENVVKNEGTTNTSYVVTDLTEDTNYNNIKVAAYINENKKESNVETTKTTKRPGTPEIQIELKSEKTALEYPVLSQKGMITCYVSIKEGDPIVLKITNTETNLTNYYSTDKGNTWIKYETPKDIQYPGTGNLMAKSVNNSGLESEIAVGVVPDREYFYDPNSLPTASDALDIAAYDGDLNTYAEVSSGKTKFYIAEDAFIHKIGLDVGNNTGVLVNWGTGGSVETGEVWQEKIISRKYGNYWFFTKEYYRDGKGSNMLNTIGMNTYEIIYNETKED